MCKIPANTICLGEPRMIRQEPADVEIAGVLCHSRADVLRELDQLAFS
jgi:hypothetical protein